ncbi:MAG: YceI family protein [Bacteroidota bacterium]|nr:YceI family protein [Candidatus Kapabacteria bacterium]MCX7937730.1 YceI family protein [Chlorobiota bacterium]MDW8074150.1 YceI family protein [Bacteroidota bacterium]MDW8271374.1 YceI family protein [Bacteroidota bacterium]
MKIVLVLVWLVLCGLRAEEKTFVLTNVGKYRNQVQFTSSAPLETIVGTAEGFSGEFTLDIPSFSRASGVITLQVRSMKTGNATRDRHMYASEWLDADQYPTIQFRLKRLDNPRISREEGRIVVTATAIGDFALHGVTRELPAQVTITYLERSEKTRSISSGDLCLVQATFSVPLAQFGIKGKGTLIGSRVGETISIEATLFGVSQQ